MDLNDRMPTSNIPAEKAALAAMMSSGQAIADCAELLTPPDFFQPQHQVIFGAMIAMFAAREPVTPVTLRAWLEHAGERFNPAYLLDLYGIPVPGPMALAHARLVWECAVRRRIELAGTQMAQMSAQMDESPAELIARVQQLINALAEGSVPDDNRALTTDQFLALGGVFSTPIIPGLLDHQDRVVVVGVEGDGKSTLAFQVAYALGSGIHPFVFSPINPGRSLIVDLENPRQILQRRLGDLQEVAARHASWAADNVMLWARPGGVDITRASDAFKLADVIRENRPDLIVAGPVYKMFEEGDHDGPKHAAICRFFDQMRERYGCAVWLETHVPIQQSAGKRVMRPLGSGIWTRWPEFGLALIRNGKRDGSLMIEKFRGDREQGRQWPEKLTRNLMPKPCWPWLATYAAGTFMEPLREAE